MISVAAGAVADDFGQDVRAAFFVKIQCFQNQYRSAFADNKTIAGFIERTGGVFGVVVAGGQGAGSIEAGNPDGSNDSFRTAGDNRYAVSPFEDFVGVTDGVGAAGSGRGGADIRAFGADIDGNLGSGHIGNHHRDKERTDPVRAFLV